MESQLQQQLQQKSQPHLQRPQLKQLQAQLHQHQPLEPTSLLLHNQLYPQSSDGSPPQNFISNSNSTSNTTYSNNPNFNNSNTNSNFSLQNSPRRNQQSQLHNSQDQNRNSAQQIPGVQTSPSLTNQYSTLQQLGSQSPRTQFPSPRNSTQHLPKLPTSTTSPEIASDTQPHLPPLELALSNPENQQPTTQDPLPSWKRYQQNILPDISQKSTTPQKTQRLTRVDTPYYAGNSLRDTDELPLQSNSPPSSRSTQSSHSTSTSSFTQSSHSAQSSQSYSSDSYSPDLPQNFFSLSSPLPANASTDYPQIHDMLMHSAPLFQTDMSSTWSSDTGRRGGKRKRKTEKERGERRGRGEGRKGERRVRKTKVHEAQSNQGRER